MISMQAVSRIILAPILSALLVVSVAAQTPPSPAPAPQASAAQPAPAPSAKPPAQPPSPENQAMLASLEEARKVVEDVETRAANQDLGSDQLQELRARLDPVADQLRELIAAIEPKLDAAKVRLSQLGPKPKEGAEGADVARDRAEREASVGELDESLKLARALLVQTEQLTGQISDRRRSAFARALFQRSYSILSPELWMSMLSSFPRDVRALQALGSDAWWQLEHRSGSTARILLGIALAAGLALHLARRRIVPRLVQRDPNRSEIGPTRRLLAALGVLVVETLPAVLASFILYQALVALDLLPYRAVPLAGALLAGIAFLAFLRALIDAIFAPDAPAWRLVQVPEKVAGTILGLGVTFATIVVIGRVVDAVNQSIAAGLPLSIAAKGVTAILAAATLAALLYRLSDEEADVSDEACLGPYIPTGPTVAGPVRLAGWVLVAAVVGAALSGYVAFATFLLDQVLWTASLAGLLFLALRCCDRFVGGALVEDSRVTTALQSNLGLRKKALQQLGIVASGVLRVVLWIVAAMLVLAPWGIESGDITTNLRAAFFGFKVGDVTISLSTVIMALALFGGLIALARILQRWLTTTLLPTTELDSGLRNSVATATGYIGFFVAAAAAFTFLGLSLEKIAIVAGALSVGIGFGLQSIVNNFVSGLILLWERPIRVGDLVVVGGDEGHVRKISVRATEIETFDRSTIIVPNSSLISGTVKNRMRQNAIGRILISIKVLRNQDPARAAELLVAQATSHPDVMKEPAPRVLFKKIGETFLDFDLICFVADIGIKARVESEINFSILGALSSEGIFPAMGPDTHNVAGLEPLQEALKMIAGAIAERESKGEARSDSRRGTATTAPSEDPPPEETSDKPRLVGKRSRS
jgi:small-conductance mechanosensitive channel